MKLKVFIILNFIISSFAIDEHRSKLKDARGKRNLEYSISHNYPIIGANFRQEKRLSSTPSGLQLPLKFPSYFGSRQHGPISKRIRADAVPPYAVQMEPLVQYSQRDPLYDSGKLALSLEGHNDLTKPDDLSADNNHLNENFVHHTARGSVPEPIYYQKEPEPIIEIIIKESNVTLPPVPVPTAPPKKKEQVQVFYVKYKKNPNPDGSGKDSIIYDPPIPALTPIKEEHNTHTEPPVQEYVTLPPAPTTTIRTIIRPDSETYIGTKGIHVTFGSEHKKEKVSEEGHVESAPQPSVVFPNHRQSTYNDQRSQYNQPVPNFNIAHHQSNQQLPTREYQNFNQHSSLNNPQPYSTLPNFPPRPQLHQSRPFTQPFPQPPSAQPPQNFPQHPRFNFNQNRPLPVNQHAQNNHQHFANQHQPVRSQYSFFNQRPQTHFPVPQYPPQTHANHYVNHNYNTINFQNQQPKQIQQPLNHNQQTQKINHPQQPFVNNNHQFPNRPPTPPTNNYQTIHPSQQNTQFYYQNQPQLQNFQQLPNVQQHNQFQQFKRQQIPTKQPIFQQTNSQINNQQIQTNTNPRQPYFIPPGGELVKSVPKYEQHLAVSVDSNGAQVLQPINPQTHQIEGNSNKVQNFQNPHITQNQQLNYQAAQLNNQQHQQFTRLQSTGEHTRNLSPQDFRHQILDQFQNNLAQYNTQSVSPKPQNSENHKQVFSNAQQSSSQQYQHDYQQRSKEQNPVVYQTSPRTSTSSTTNFYHSTTTKPTTTKTVETTTEKQEPTKATIPPNIQLPDEVPDDLREQLLSSGILSNADISVLDYDKVGDIPIEALPPEQLANFYGAGGGQQIASASEQKVSVVEPNEDFNNDKKDFDQELETEASEIDEVKMTTKGSGVEMKVVHYDPESKEGQAVQDKYVRDDATQVEPVVLNDEKYNKYLPIKISGAHFPIPDVPELKGRNVTSVVVLAPIDYEFEGKHLERAERDVAENVRGLRLLAGQALKEVIKNPTLDNYKKWLEKENDTVSDKQSVVLLVTGTNSNDTKEKEIYMYNVATRSVSKLSGELSSAFVEAAESNGDEKDIEAIPAASTREETRVPFPQADDMVETVDDLEGENSDISEQFIAVSDIQDEQNGDLLTAATNHEYTNKVLINTGYSKTGMSRPSY